MANIELNNITNTDGTGVFDKLMEAVNKQIETQYFNNRITGNDYANVYLGGMQAVLQQSMQFALQEQLTEAQIEDVVAGTALKAKQLDIAEQERLAKAFEVTDILPAQRDKLLKDIDVAERSIAEQEATGVKQRLAIDKDIDTKERQTAIAESKLADELLTSTKQRLLLDTEEQAKQYEVDNILPANLAQIQKQTDVAERGMVDQETTSVKQRLSIDKDIEVKERQTTIAESKLADDLLTSAKQRTLLDTEEEAKQFEVDFLLPEQKIKLQEEIDLLQTQDSEAQLDGSKRRALQDEQIKVAYAERVTKDKQAAKLGLDNVMKQSELRKDQDPSFVYAPNYEDNV